MDNNLSLVPLLRTSATNVNSLQLFPLGSKSHQRVIVGSQDGILQCVSMKRGTLQEYFKVNYQKPICGIQMHKDKAFVATSNGIVRGINKAGKEFYKMSSTISETTQFMDVRVPHLWLSGEYLCLAYVEDEQVNYYSSRERINCLTSQTILEKGVYNAVIGCQDRMVRVLHKNDVDSEILVEGAVTAVAPYNPTATRNEILYATENGTLGVLGINNGYPYFGWKVDDKSYVTTIDTHDYTQDGTIDILIGRDNGSVQVFSQTENGPQKIFDRNLNESITSVRAGQVVGHSQDIVLSTYSGKVSVFTGDEPMEEAASTSKSNKKFNIKDSVKKRFGKSKDPSSNKAPSHAKEKRIESLQKDINKLEEKISQMKNKYSKISEEMVAVHCKYSVKSKFILDSSMASYRLTIELDIPIEMLALSCNTYIDILDSDTRGTVIATSKEENSIDGMPVKSIIRCTEDSNRIEVLLRTVEGQFGQVEAYIIPKLTPKTSQAISFPIKPLSLHERVHKIDLPQNLNILTIEGQFSLEEIHGWIALCLEGIPDRVIDDEVEYFFRSTFQNTVLSVKLKRGEAVFSSNNASTISILDEMISKLATDRKTRIQTSFKANEASFEEVLRLLYPKLEYQMQLSEKVKRIDSLKEIQMQEEDISFLTEEYKHILENEKQLRQELRMQSQRLDFLSTIIIRLLEDKYKYKRQSNQKPLGQLQDLLSGKSFSLEQLFSVFRS